MTSRTGPATLAKGPARGQDAATVAGAFKQLLRLSPECVLTNAAYAEFVRAATDAGKLRALIAALPAPNQAPCCSDERQSIALQK